MLLLPQLFVRWNTGTFPQGFILSEILLSILDWQTLGPRGIATETTCKCSSTNTACSFCDNAHYCPDAQMSQEPCVMLSLRCCVPLVHTTEEKERGQIFEPLLWPQKPKQWLNSWEVYGGPGRLYPPTFLSAVSGLHWALYFCSHLTIRICARRSQWIQVKPQIFLADTPCCPRQKHLSSHLTAEQQQPKLSDHLSWCTSSPWCVLTEGSHPGHRVYECT